MNRELIIKSIAIANPQMNISEIAKATNISRQTVAKVLKDFTRNEAKSENELTTKDFTDIAKDLLISKEKEFITHLKSNLSKDEIIKFYN